MSLIVYLKGRGNALEASGKVACKNHGYPYTNHEVILRPQENSGARWGLRRVEPFMPGARSTRCNRSLAHAQSPVPERRRRLGRFRSTRSRCAECCEQNRFRNQYPDFCVFFLLPDQSVFLKRVAEESSETQIGSDERLIPFHQPT
jgi:hypothetical protein